MLQFNKIKLINFGSYCKAEVDLQNKGFCLVSGENRYAKDNALSNGSGKSFLWSGICFALTGETIQGLTKNLRNINADSEESSVTLDFISDADHYIITRYIAPKSDLKIMKNGTDVSGKGIRESEIKLAELLPDVTKDLIASTILIGQGMPNKFSSFSPSGRKELLEKLTKSDFMLADIKDRVARRFEVLNTQIRQAEDAYLVQNTKLVSTTTILEGKKAELASAVKPDFDTAIKNSTTLVNSIQKDIDACNTNIKKFEALDESLTKELLDLTAKKTAESTEELSKYNSKYNELNTEKVKLESNISNLNKEITRLKAIKDVCPTCGQKLQGVEKPNTDKQEAELKQLNESLSSQKSLIETVNKKHAGYLEEIKNRHDANIASKNQAILENKKDLSKEKDTLNDCIQAQNVEKDRLSKLQYDKENWDKALEALAGEITKLSKELETIAAEIKKAEEAKTDTEAHIDVVKKMDTLIKRDFRGYLLSNIINYINLKAKDYCEIVFGTRELNIYLAGNNLDISYCGKMIDNLSGGEKTRVDLIIQLAIRDLMCHYFNYSCNMIVLDEVTDFLDKKSCDAIMKLLEKELNAVESVFIISHHAATLAIPVDSNLYVVKDEDGISTVS